MNGLKDVTTFTYSSDDNVLIKDFRYDDDIDELIDITTYTYSDAHRNILSKLNVRERNGSPESSGLVTYSYVEIEGGLLGFLLNNIRQ